MTLVAKQDRLVPPDFPTELIDERAGGRLDTPKHRLVPPAFPTELIDGQAGGRLDTPKHRVTPFVRPYLADDMAAVLALYRQVFGAAAAVSFQARWRWALQDNLCPKESHAWVLSDKQRVLGFLAAIPLPYLIGGVQVVAHTPADFMVDPQARFHGVKLMQEFFRACPNVVSLDDIPATIKVTRWLGASEVAKVARYAKVLDARMLRSKRPWGAVPPPFLWGLTQGLRWTDRMCLPEVPKAQNLRLVSDFDDRFEHFFRDQGCATPAAALRDSRFLRWRYGSESPHAGRRVLVLADSQGSVQGYVIFYTSGRNHTGYVLDLETIVPGDPRAEEILLAHAVEQMRRDGAWIVRCHCLDSGRALQKLLDNQGFVLRGAHQLLVRFQDAKVAAVAADPRNWNIQYGDAEASHASS